MSPEIIQAALKQVLADMGGAARKAKASKFMRPPMADEGLDEIKGGDAVPPDAMSGAAGGAAEDALDGGADDAQEDEPTDDELAMMMKGAR